VSTPILATELYIPQPQPRVVLRPRLIEHLNEGLHRRLLLSRPAAATGEDAPGLACHGGQLGLAIVCSAQQPLTASS
jgi:hypothetical protein